MLMYLSVKDSEATNYSAYFNGVRLPYCFAASEEEGWADVYQLNEAGMLMLDKDENLKIKRIFGEVKFMKVPMNPQILLISSN